MNLVVRKISTNQKNLELVFHTLELIDWVKRILAER